MNHTVSQQVKQSMAIYYISVLAVLTLCLFEFSPPPGSDLYLVILVLLGSLTVGFYQNRIRSNLTDLVCFIAIINLYLIPYIGYWLRGESVSLVFYPLVLLVSAVFSWIVPVLRPTRCTISKQSSSIHLTLSICFLLVSFIAGFWSPPLRLALLGLSWVEFSRLTRRLTNPKSLFLLVYLVCYSFYFIAVYYGSVIFGRLAFFVMLSMPLFIMYINSLLPVNAFYIICASIPLSLIGLLLRMDTVVFNDLGASSVGHHIIVMSDLLNDSNIHDGSLHYLFEQFSLFYLNWFPRELWPSKPAGLGLTIVDYYYGRIGVSEGFSVSLGLFGEHLFLAKYAWVLTTFLSIVSIALSLRLFRFFFSKWVAMYVSLNVWLIAYYWGGFGTFGAYAWITMAGMPIYYLICSALATQGNSFVSRASSKT